ncbi:TonB-dependent receptor [Pelomonas sp. SE-A7]|uniref:TonB-dependent siderophore receptor n=1 Tax=Pelomonas sp. SE-A7 TaxID=3054953 RepID=UPI00259CB752|nr:TonB-dependent receptor [Pelomonas sp. SE-A7]MDM4766149.1 TonB-dependent receptor [Pelomonas sp. SE-A7]
MAIHLSLTRIAAALALMSTAAAAQQLPTVSVTGRSAEAPVQIGGFGDTPVAKLPLQANLVGTELLLANGIQNLAGLTLLDASVGDAYNSQGYVSYLKIRGFDLDNRFNYRRDGLPINAETAIALGNKAGVEILKGASGIQAGTSAPGGLVNLIVKRPTAEIHSLTLGFSERGTAEVSTDLSHRFGNDREFGLRLNASTAHVKPQLNDTRGQRHLFALAGDWKLSPDTKLEAEFEANKQTQASQPGFSLLGNKLPDAKSIDPRINLNNQAWSQPVVFDNSFASLRWQQRLSGDWKAQAHWGRQALKTDDRLAYPFGCSAADGTYWASSYCPNGDFDMWDFRSENERRNSDATDFSLSGSLVLGGLRHQITTGLLFTRFWSRFQGQAYNWAGTGNISGQARTVADGSLYDANTNRDEHSREFYLRDAVALTAELNAWLGLRHSRVERSSYRVNTSDTRATDYDQGFTTPWLGLSYAINPQLMAYASWGQGIESEVAPNRSRYSNRGQALPALKSEQLEFGLKSGSKTVDWSLAAFDIKRPAWRDFGNCDSTANSCVRHADGEARHRGLEAQADLKWEGGGLLGSWMQLRARNQGSAIGSLNGLRPANVPETTIKLQARQQLFAGLQAQLGLVREGAREVLPDNSLQLPAWTRIDAALRFDHQVGRTQWIWRAGVDNLTNRRAWKESPYQYEHVYLYPLAPRSWRASLELSL